MTSILLRDPRSSRRPRPFGSTYATSSPPSSSGRSLAQSKSETHDRLAQRVRGAVALFSPAERRRFEEEWIAEMGAGLEKYGPRWAVKYTRGLSQAAQDISPEEAGQRLAQDFQRSKLVLVMSRSSRGGICTRRDSVGRRRVAHHRRSEQYRPASRSVADVSLTTDALSGPRAASQYVPRHIFTTDALSGPRAASPVGCRRVAHHRRSERSRAASQ